MDTTLISLLATVLFVVVADLAATGLLIYRTGRYVGQTESKIGFMVEKIAVVEGDLKSHFQYDMGMDRQIQETQVKHGETLARLESELGNLQKDMLTLRDWRHNVSNVMAGIALKLELPLSREAKNV
jgi:hypothetical protein